MNNAVVNVDANENEQWLRWDDEIHNDMMGLRKVGLAYQRRMDWISFLDSALLDIDSRCF